MKSNNPPYAPCAICKSRPADKTNSHLIPSFFIAMVSSIDNSYKRDKELLYTIGQDITTAYIGRSVKEEDLLNSFDSITDERLEMMKDNTDSKDYIFCSHCEKKLGEYLESPWHDHLFSNKPISPDAAYFFWVSLLWRISAFESIHFKLPTHIEKSLRKRLNSYIETRDNKGDISLNMVHLPFSYKVLYCKDYSKSHGGLIYYEYNPKTKIATLLLGDVAACFTFNRHKTFDRLSFYGLESIMAEAPINDGSCSESIDNISADVLDAANIQLITEIKKIRLQADRRNIINLWKAVIKKGMRLPLQPIEPFIQFVIYKLYDDSVKTGERITHEYFVKCFGAGLERFYGINLI